MDHNMVFYYGYCRWQNQQWYQHVTPPTAIWMAMVVCWCDTKCIAQCSMSRATPEATGRWHRAITCSVSPQRPPGQQANKQQSTNITTKLAILMAMAMHRYVTARIAQWRRSRASLEATGCRHRVSIMSDKLNRTWLRWYIQCFHCQNCRKRSWVDAKRTLFLIGVWNIKRKRRA